LASGISREGFNGEHGELREFDELYDALFGNAFDDLDHSHGEEIF
jgi:hypothetical protein